MKQACWCEWREIHPIMITCNINSIQASGKFSPGEGSLTPTCFNSFMSDVGHPIIKIMSHAREFMVCFGGARKNFKTPFENPDHSVEDQMWRQKK